MQPRLGRRRADAVGHRAGDVDFEDLVGRQLALWRSACRDGKPQRLALDDTAQVAAGAEHPAALVEATANLGEAFGDVRARNCHDRQYCHV